MKRKGFTLIELLAVIVILAIIALIAVPVIMNIIAKSNKSAFKDSAYGIIKAGELYYSDKLLEQNGMESDVAFEFPSNIEGLDIKGSMPSSGEMFIYKTGEVSLAISNGKYCARKQRYSSEVTIDEDIENCNIDINIIDIFFEKEEAVVLKETGFTVITTVDVSEISVLSVSWENAIYGELKKEVDLENNQIIWTSTIRPTSLNSREYKFYAEGINSKKVGPLRSAIKVVLK